MFGKKIWLKIPVEVSYDDKTRVKGAWIIAHRKTTIYVMEKVDDISPILRNTLHMLGIGTEYAEWFE